MDPKDQIIFNLNLEIKQLKAENQQLKNELAKKPQIQHHDDNRSSSPRHKPSPPKNSQKVLPPLSIPAKSRILAKASDGNVSMDNIENDVSRVAIQRKIEITQLKKVTDDL
jgi:hypothetical protein